MLRWLLSHFSEGIAAERDRAAHKAALYAKYRAALKR